MGILLFGLVIATVFGGDGTKTATSSDFKCDNKGEQFQMKLDIKTETTSSKSESDYAFKIEVDGTYKSTTSKMVKFESESATKSSDGSFTNETSSKIRVRVQQVGIFATDSGDDGTLVTTKPCSPITDWTFACPQNTPAGAFDFNITSVPDALNLHSFFVMDNSGNQDPSTIEFLVSMEWSKLCTSTPDTAAGEKFCIQMQVVSVDTQSVKDKTTDSSTKMKTRCGGSSCFNWADVDGNGKEINAFNVTGDNGVADEDDSDFKVEKELLFCVGDTGNIVQWDPSIGPNGAGLVSVLGALLTMLL